MAKKKKVGKWSGSGKNRSRLYTYIVFVWEKYITGLFRQKREEWNAMTVMNMVLGCLLVISGKFTYVRGR